MCVRVWKNGIFMLMVLRTVNGLSQLRIYAKKKPTEQIHFKISKTAFDVLVENVTTAHNI